MLDLVKDLVQSKASEFLGGQNLSDEQVNQATEVAGDSVVGELSKQVMSGNLGEITKLLSGESGGISESPIVKNIIGSFAGDLMSKVGLGSDSANGIASSLIPTVMSALSGKFQSEDEGDAGFDLGAIAGMLGGESGGNLMDNLKNMAGDQLQDKAKDLLGGFFK